MVAELVAQAAHVDLDEVRAGIEARPPDTREELGACHHLLGVMHEVEEESVLAGGEVEDLSAERYLATDAVELERADSELREARRAAVRRAGSAP